MCRNIRTLANFAPPATEAEKRLREIPNGLALQLLKLHQTLFSFPMTALAWYSVSRSIGICVLRSC